MNEQQIIHRTTFDPPKDVHVTESGRGHRFQAVTAIESPIHANQPSLQIFQGEQLVASFQRWDFWKSL